MATRTQCPICKAAASSARSENAFAPFCSSRCRMVDLGNWLGEAYRIPASNQDSLDEGDEVARVPPRGERE